MSDSADLERWLGATPYAQALGVRLAEASGERVVLELPFLEANANPGGALHGGVAASLASIGAQAAGRAVLDPPGDALFCAGVHVSYLSAAISEGVRAEARVLRPGKGLAFVAIDVETEAGKAIATATATLRSRSGDAPELAASAGDDGAANPGPMGPGVEQLGFIAARGIRIEHMDGGTSRLRMPFQEGNADVDGGVHEGAVLALLDTAGAMASWGEVGVGRHKASTPAIQARTLSPAPAAELVAHARVVQQDQEILWSEVEVASVPDARVVTRGTVIYRIVVG